MIVHLTNDVVDMRYAWATTIDEVVARKGGVAADYAAGDHPVGSTRDADGVITPPAPDAALKRARLSAAITAEQERRLTAASLVFDADGAPRRLALDARSIDYLAAYRTAWTRGEVAPSYAVAVDGGAAVSLSAGAVKLLSDGAETYRASLPVASGAIQATLTATADADLAGFSIPAAETWTQAGDAAWPSTDVAVDLASPPSAPSALEAWRASVESRLAALEGA